MKPSVYIETTIVSYLTARPSRDVLQLSHQMITRDWWDQKRAEFELYVSDFVIEEASAGDANAARERLRLLNDLEVLATTGEVRKLTKRLFTEMALPARAEADAAHVATCAVYAIDFLLTWNCTHLANGMLADKIDAACAASGYRAPRIITPNLLMGGS